MEKEKTLRLLLVVFVLGLFFYLISSFTIPIVFAASVSLTLYPLYEFLLNKGMKRHLAALLLTSFFGLVISIPLFFFIYKGTTSVTEKLQELTVSGKFRHQGVGEILSGMRLDLLHFIQKLLSKYRIELFKEEKIEESLNFIVTYLLKLFQNFLSNLPTIFLLLIVMIICVHSFLLHGRVIRDFSGRLFGFSEKKMETLSRTLMMDCRQVYLSNMITGGIQSILVASGVSLLGMGEFFLLFFITIILSFIPVIGASPVAFLFSLMAFLKGDSSSALILLILGLFVGIVDNILRPWLTTLGSSRIPPVAAFVCVVGGALWLGFSGLFIGLLIGTVTFDVLPLFWNTEKVPRSFSHEN